MLFGPATDFFVPPGPPPQVVLDQRWLWQVLIFLLGVTFALRLFGLDIPGALLTGLMLCFAVIMTRDGMQEISRYALVYAILCGLNFFFDSLPLLTEMSGRVRRTAEPVQTVSEDGYKQTMYNIKVKVTPFFDSTQGLVYNIQSLAMIMSPICMALGLYLAFTAHSEIQRQTAAFWEDDQIEDGFPGLGRFQGPPPPQPPPPRPGGPGDPLVSQRMQRRPGEGFERFQGRGYKLDPDN